MSISQPQTTEQTSSASIESVPIPAQKTSIHAPVLIAHKRKAYWLTLDGEILTPSNIELTKLISQHMPIVCHAPFVAQQLSMTPFIAYDILELFAFVHPARFCLPSIGGVVAELSLHDLPISSAEEQSIATLETVQRLLDDLQSEQRQEQSDPISIASMMGLGSDGIKHQIGWAWSGIILQALGSPNGHGDAKTAKNGTKVWNRLQEWAEDAPPPPAGHEPVSEEEALICLKNLLNQRGLNTRERPEQETYTKNLIKAFSPRDHENIPNTVVAEAGTGIGKTLGYLAPASVWAEKNQGAVWISTYTKNLQRQVDQELDNLYQDADEKKRNVVVRKGRENYLCLLNLEEALNSLAAQNNQRYAIGIGLMLRWAAASRDGDLYGGDLPGWLIGILEWKSTLALADRRGECMFAACSHYHRCFIEKSQRLSQRAKIVIANHALVMNRTALSHPHDSLPNRYIFDEGHHIFDAADSAFSLHLSGQEAADLRHWLLGIETTNSRSPSGGRNGGRNRGLQRRLEELIANDDEAKHALEDIIEAARSLPSHSWQQRLQSEQPKGLMEGFLFLVRQQIYARNSNGHDVVYSLETGVFPAIDGLFESSYALSCRLRDLSRPMQKIISILQTQIEENSETMATDTKKRIESICHGLHQRSNQLIAGWIDMLACLQNQTKHEAFIDWFQLERIEGREYDVGMYRHWIDPTVPFAKNLQPHAHGVIVTSASLLDSTQQPEEQWDYVVKHTGISHMTADSSSTQKIQLSSPYDYGKQSRILVLTDIPRDNTGQIAMAYAALFKASGGGALGLFTAIQRLKAVHSRLLPELEKNNLQLYAQHLDGLDPTTITEMFRMDEDSCMLGTDATRDGMDVPGRALRLIAFDRVPWPRPDILHKARRDYFGRGYDDRITRFRLKQAYGRLIRHEDDKGIFVMLDNRLPSRLCSAFPSDVQIERVELAKAIDIIKDFSQ